MNLSALQGLASAGQSLAQSIPAVYEKWAQVEGTKSFGRAEQAMAEVERIAGLPIPEQAAALKSLDPALKPFVVEYVVKNRPKDLEAAAGLFQNRGVDVSAVHQTLASGNPTDLAQATPFGQTPATPPAPLGQTPATPPEPFAQQSTDAPAPPPGSLVASANRSASASTAKTSGLMNEDLQAQATRTVGDFLARPGRDASGAQSRLDRLKMQQDFVNRETAQRGIAPDATRLEQLRGDITAAEKELSDAATASESLAGTQGTLAGTLLSRTTAEETRREAEEGRQARWAGDQDFKRWREGVRAGLTRERTAAMAALKSEEQKRNYLKDQANFSRDMVDRYRTLKQQWASLGNSPSKQKEFIAANRDLFQDQESKYLGIFPGKKTAVFDAAYIDDMIDYYQESGLSAMEGMQTLNGAPAGRDRPRKPGAPAGNAPKKPGKPRAADF